MQTCLLVPIPLALFKPIFYTKEFIQQYCCTGDPAAPLPTVQHASTTSFPPITPAGLALSPVVTAAVKGSVVERLLQ
eukprot:1146984-Pelagomonas_calceolata.AAC.8